MSNSENKTDHLLAAMKAAFRHPDVQEHLKKDSQGKDRFDHHYPEGDGSTEVLWATGMHTPGYVDDGIAQFVVAAIRYMQACDEQ